MIRALVEQTFDATKKYFVLAGLSTDSKPTTGLITGSKFLEVDTGVNYVFDEVGGTWSASTITEQEIKDEIDSWLENNIDPDSGYALDRTLSLSNAAAPADMVGDLKSAIALEEENIPGTTQTISFDSSGNVSQIVHTNSNNVAVRTDVFTFGVDTITEVRTLNTGESLTIVTNTDTLVTTVTYAAA